MPSFYEDAQAGLGPKWSTRSYLLQGAAGREDRDSLLACLLVEPLNYGHTQCLFKSTCQKLKIITIISYKKGHLLITKGKMKGTPTENKRPSGPIERRGTFTLNKKQNPQPYFCMYFFQMQKTELLLCTIVLQVIVFLVEACYFG